MPWIDFNLSNNESDQLTEEIVLGALSAMDLKAIIMNEISEWKGSDALKWMGIGQNYYLNETDIKERVRKAVGESGALEPVINLANNRLANAFTRKLVNQKVGYLLSKPMNIRTDDKKYQEYLDYYFDKKFMRQIQSLGTQAINKGIAWLHPYYDDNGNLTFMIIPSEQCIPIWKDAAHTELQAMIRNYQVIVYEGKQRKEITKVEWWDTKGVRRYEQKGNELVEDVELGDISPHFVVGDSGVNWERVPFIAFKYNDDEMPLIRFIKELVDDYDKQKSDNANNLEDLPNSIYVVKNYGDVRGADFRKNIAQYRVVFTESDGGVDSVDIEINTEAVKYHQEQNRKDIYEFGRGVDTQTTNLGNASGVALKFLYADLDMDCNILENQFQAALEQLLWFIDTDLFNKGLGDFSDKEVEFIFNRDIIINETEVIENINKSYDLSEETRLAQHPYVDNVQDELMRKKKERTDKMKEIEPPFSFPRGDEE